MEDMKGFMKNAHGGYDPVSAIKPIDLARDDLVKDIVAKSEEMSRAIADMKKGFFDDVKAFLDLSAEKYNVTLGGKKGNLTLVSYDGSYKVLVAVNESIQFDERLLAAKELIDECIQEWSKDSREERRFLRGKERETQLKPHSGTSPPEHHRREMEEGDGCHKRLGAGCRKQGIHPHLPAQQRRRLRPCKP